MKKIIKEIKKNKPDLLEKEIQKIREEITKIRLEMKTNPIKDTNIIRKKKKRIAAILTVLSEIKNKSYE